jgi:3-keto-L-gulonate-6-phosphate decarboxylase
MIELLRWRGGGRSVVHHQSTDVFRSPEAFLENLARQQVLMDDTAGSGLTGGSLREEAAKGAALNPAQVVIGRILRASRSLATRSSKPSTSRIP